MDSTNYCNQIDESLDAFHDGELDESMKATVQQHLSGCSSCQRKVDDLGRLVVAIKSGAKIEAPSRLSVKLDAIADGKYPGKVSEPAILSRAWMPIAAGVVAIVACIGMFVSQPHQVATTTPKVDAPKTAVVAQSPVAIKPTVATSHAETNNKPPAAGANAATDDIRNDDPEMSYLANSLDDAVGISTDEDGIYEIKL